MKSRLFFLICLLGINLAVIAQDDVYDEPAKPILKVYSFGNNNQSNSSYNDNNNDNNYNGRYSQKLNRMYGYNNSPSVTMGMGFMGGYPFMPYYGSGFSMTFGNGYNNAYMNPYMNPYYSPYYASYYNPWMYGSSFYGGSFFDPWFGYGNGFGYGGCGGGYYGGGYMPYVPPIYGGNYTKPNVVPNSEDGRPRGFGRYENTYRPSNSGNGSNPPRYGDNSRLEPPINNRSSGFSEPSGGFSAPSGGMSGGGSPSGGGNGGRTGRF